MEDDESSLKKRIESCIQELQKGMLTEARLRELLEAATTRKPRQELLYMQLQNTNPGSMALGMTIFRQGRLVEPPLDPKDWPYQSALHAIQDGWRVISFPNLVLLCDPVTPQGLGCEFILEKWA